jgi:hypothetical protein
MCQLAPVIPNEQTNRKTQNSEILFFSSLLAFELRTQGSTLGKTVALTLESLFAMVI